MPFRMGRRLKNAYHAKRNLNPARIVVTSFLLIILLGAWLLTLPVSTRSGAGCDGLTALFTATSATCVTGLVTQDTWQFWSPVGQVVILGMIQLGGLGFMTVLCLFSLLRKRRIGLGERLIMVSALNLNDMDGVVRVVRHALAGTFLLEGVGAIVLAIRFIPRFGVAGGLWRGVFHSVSAFCNAGFDLMGEVKPGIGLALYQDDPVVLVTVMALIIIGGLGFFVWEDILLHRGWKGLSLYSKLVLAVTGLLLVTGTVLFLGVEWSNPATLGPMAPGKKVLNAAFQSVTLRTAGFATVDQAGLHEASLAVGCLFMLVGGASGSTAGGVKVGTLGVLLLTLRAGLRGDGTVLCKGRAVARDRVLSALTLVLTVAGLFFLAALAINLADDVDFLHAAYEAASALGTVGLSAGVTPGLNQVSQVMLICFMFLGRVGLLSFSVAFLTRANEKTKLRYPTFNVMIG